MANLTLAERLQARFGGRVECQWGIPSEKYLAAYLIGVKKEPNSQELNELITKYFANHGFTRMNGLGELTFQDLQGKNHRVACATYSESLQKLIVSAAEF